jgi:hypothetical protein
MFTLGLKPDKRYLLNPFMAHHLQDISFVDGKPYKSRAGRVVHFSSTDPKSDFKSDIFIAQQKKIWCHDPGFGYSDCDPF